MGGRLKAEQQQRDAEAEQQRKAAERGVPVAREGSIVAGSWRAEDSSVEVLFCDTYSAFGDDPNVTPVNQPRVPLWTMQPSDAYGPVGGERCHLVPTQSGYAAILQGGVPVMATGIDGSNPNVPSGERWIAHRNAAGEIDAFTKHTNDGPTPGDGLGGAHYGGHAALTKQTTKYGHVIELNDATKAITVTTPGGHSATFDDTNEKIEARSAGGHLVTVDDNAETQGVKVQTAGGLLGHLDDVAMAITHQAAAGVASIVDGQHGAVSLLATVAGGRVGLGDIASNLAASGYGAVNEAILTTMGSNVDTSQLSNLQALCTAFHAAGAITSAQLTTLLGIVISSWLTSTVVPSGSPTVRVAH